VVRYVLAWLPMIAIAVANGAVREAWLLPRLGDLLARQISTVSLLGLLAIYIGVVFKFWPLASVRLALGVGVAWLALTLAFEFGLGYFVSHLTWRQMLAEYDLSSGRLWILVPIWVAVAPYVFYTLQERR
jgi:hypothetical protein